MDALLLTLKLAFFSNAILIVIATPIAWFLAHSQFKGKFLVEALLVLPLVLSHPVLGFYLLLAFVPL